jgi:hypothetical protein
MNCPCESGLKSEDCCLLPDGDWFKNPTPFTPHPPQTGFSHPDCYLFHTKDCSTKISDEHYVSETVLKAVDDVLKVSGFPWLKPGESKKGGNGVEMGSGLRLTLVDWSRFNGA